MSNSDRLASLDILRGIASLSVCWYHVTHGGKLLPDGVGSMISSFGHLGVAVFFVISGFVIPWSLRETSFNLGAYGQFLAKRMVRLHPPFVIACIITIGLNKLTMPKSGKGFDLQAALTTLGGDALYLNGILGHSWTLVVAWTLALEVQFYVLAGVMAPLLNPALRPRCLFLVLSIGCCVGILFPDAVWVFRWLPLFTLGWAASWMRIHPKSWLNWLSVLISMASILYQFDNATLLLATLAFVLVRFPLLKPVSILTWFGAISYSLYLVHVPIGGRVVNLGMRLNPDSFGRWGISFAAMAASIVAAWTFHQFIEQPCQRWSRQLFARRTL